MRFQLLGPVRGWIDGQPVSLGVRKQRLVLAVLALEVGTLVPTSRLVDLIWSGRPPASARGRIHTHVSGLRAILGRTGSAAVSLLRHPAGYELSCDPSRVDAHRFLKLTSQARATSDEEQRLARLDQALHLWQGPALAGVATEELRSRLCHHLEQARLTAIEDRAEALLRLGRHHGLADQLTALSGEHPTRQRLTHQLMLALHRTGHTAEALHAYDRTRRHLADELGIDPATELQELHRTLLRGDLLPSSPPPMRSVPTPAQLPADVSAFTGRTTELTRLDTLLTTPARRTVVISAVSGTAGVGKTTLAVHWAHRVRQAFPDGQLYVNLRGFDPTGSAMAPAEAVRVLLEALEVPPQRIPVSLDAKVGLYRSLLSGRRMLVVLDNARDSAQVRPLLPGAPGSLALITSRNQLSGLIAAQGAHGLDLDLLSTTEAHELLVRRLGADRVAAEPRAVEEIIERSARLPLALTIMAARAVTHPRLSLTTLAAQLRETRDRWDALRGDDPTTDVRVVFSWSYQTLTPAAARLFRLLGRHPGPDIAAPAAASLAAVAPTRAAQLLEELTRAHLLDQHLPGRYAFHDLLRAYAADLVNLYETPDERHTATVRTLDHYLHTAYAADRLLYPVREPIALDTPQAGVIPQRPANAQGALAWFTAERPVLLAAVDHAAVTGLDGHVWRLAWALNTFLDRRGHRHDRAAVGQTAVAAAERSGDPAAAALSHRNLAHAYLQLNQLDDAHTHLRHALDLYSTAGDRPGQARTRLSITMALTRQGHHAEALSHAGMALDLYQTAGHRYGQALALNNIGWCNANLGMHRQALDHCRQALALFEHLGDQDGQSATWDTLGYAHHLLGEHTEAVACYQRAIDLRRSLGNRYPEAATLTRIGDTHSAAGNPEDADTAWRQAMAILDELDHPEADNVEAKLRGLGVATPRHQGERAADDQGHRLRL